jgi:hypothetical protein
MVKVLLAPSPQELIDDRLPSRVFSRQHVCRPGAVGPSKSPLNVGVAWTQQTFCLRPVPVLRAAEAEVGFEVAPGPTPRKAAPGKLT